MFSRRHPYLFFVLVFLSIIAAGTIVVSMLVVMGSKGSDFEFGEKVGIIELIGVISDSKEIINNLKTFREDESIKAIIIRIDSPGGGVGPSQEIFREVRKTIKVKKVVASMGSVAASGGYYVAAGTDGIIANPGTITGSIGVIMGYTNFRKLLQKIGLVPVVIKSGEFKDMGSPAREMTEGERQILQHFTDKIHNQFVRDVAEGRNMALSRMKELADGRIYTGEDAKDLGLIDRLGNLEDAVEWAGRLGGIKGKIKVVYPSAKKIPFIKYLTDSSLSELIERIANPSLSAGYLYRPGS